MASTYSTNLKIELMATGENSGTWGNVTNTNMGTALEQAIIGLGNPDFIADANLTITISNTNSSQAARCLVLNVTSVFGSLSATRELIVPTSQKQYIVQNNTAGGQSITVKTSAGTGITVPNGRKAHLYVDGVNVIQMFDFVDINGGTIDGATVGAASASTGAFTSLTASGATTLNGAVALGDAVGDLITVPGTVNSNLLFTDNTYDIGASGATRPRNLFLAGAATIGGNLSVGGTLTLTGGVNLNGNVTVGDNSSDTLTINATITSNLLFTDNTYDIGASGATRPRNLFLAGNITAGGAQTLAGALTVDSTTDSSSTTTGSIQTDGGVGIAKALFVGTTVTAATLNLTNALGTASGGTGLGGATPFTANGVVYASSTSALATGSALTFDGTKFTVGIGSTFADAIADFYQDTNAARYVYARNPNAGAAAAAVFNASAGSGGDLRMTAYGSGHSTLANHASLFNHKLNGQLLFGVEGTEQARLTSSGLEIKQSQLIGYNDYTGIGTNGLAVAGNVGVGTASPGARLNLVDGSGDVMMTGSIISWNRNPNTGAIPDAAKGTAMINAGTTGGGSLQFWTSSGVNGSGFANRMTIDSAGNLGLGVTPSAWSALKAVELANGVSLASYIGGTQPIAYLTSGAYFNGTSWIYSVSSSPVAKYELDQGVHKWFRSTSAQVAGTDPVFSQAMTLDASGRLLVGGTGSPSSSNIRLLLQSPNATSDGGAQFAYNGAGGGGGAIFSATGSGLVFYGYTGAVGSESYTERGRFSSDGTFRVKGAGTAGSTDAFQVAGTAPADAARITSGGDLLIGTAAAASASKLDVLSSAGGVAGIGSKITGGATTQCYVAWNDATSGDNVFHQFYTEGSATLRGSITYNRTAGLTAYNTTSDYRAKDISGSVVNSGALIDSVPVYMGKMKGATQERPMFIAHEVPAYAHTGEKDAVDAEGKPVYQQMDASALIPVMWAEIQDLRKRLASLESSTLQ